MTSGAKPQIDTNGARLTIIINTNTESILSALPCAPKASFRTLLSATYLPTLFLLSL